MAPSVTALGWGLGWGWKVSPAASSPSFAFLVDHSPTNMHGQKCLKSVNRVCSSVQAPPLPAYTPEGDLSVIPFSTSSILSSSITTAGGTSRQSGPRSRSP